MIFWPLGYLAVVSANSNYIIVALFEDAFDLLPLHMCEKAFTVIEQHAQEVNYIYFTFPYFCQYVLYTLFLSLFLSLFHMHTNTHIYIIVSFFFYATLSRNKFVVLKPDHTDMNAARFCLRKLSSYCTND